MWLPGMCRTLRHTGSFRALSPADFVEQQHLDRTNTFNPFYRQCDPINPPSGRPRKPSSSRRPPDQRILWLGR